jgi:uncharacterized protein YdaL
MKSSAKERKMFSKSLVMGGVAVALASSSLLFADQKVPKLSAGVREMFVTQDDYSYGSDNMARVKYAASNAGFESLTLSVRMGLLDRRGSRVELPPQRTKLRDMETIIERIHQGNGEVTIKPIISLKPESGVADRLIDVDPWNAKLFFSSYQHNLNLYYDLARQKGIDEIVLGVGLHHLWGAKHGKDWIALAQYARLRSGQKTRLSFELTSEKDIKAFETWKRKDPGSFQEVSSYLARIRIAGSSLATIGASVERLQKLFPEKEFTLSNVTIPGCSQVVWQEDEAKCQGNSLGFTAEVQAVHLNSVTAWMKGFADLSENVRKKIVEIEFREATTEIEPEDGKEDLRCLLYNPQLKEFFLNWKKEYQSQPTPARSLASIGKKKACILYDRADSNDGVGAIHAPMLQSLLGAFRNWTVTSQSIAKYESGSLNSCDSVFYIASNYILNPPNRFYEEAAEYSKSHPLVWMNYKFSNFVKAYDQAALGRGEKALGFNVTKIDQPLSPPTRDLLDPGFFRFFDYKGETFEKAAQWNRVTNRFASNPELNLISVSNEEDVKVLSVARHSKLDSKTPYAVVRSHSEGGSVWYIADLPFAFVDYGTPYFIFCDFLWDILGETPPSGPQPALIRIEDVNPTQSQSDLRWVIDYLSDRKIPFSMAVIPYYSNLFTDPFTKRPGRWQPAYKYPEFVGTLRYAKARGASFVFHGTEHMAGDLISGYDGESAADYEFWMYPENTPHPKDSADYLLDKLERGEDVFTRLRIRPRAWESPHYAASPLDYVLFGKLFEWTYHRPIYFDATLKADVSLPKKYRMHEQMTSEQRDERRKLLRGVQVDGTLASFSGQIVPYPVYRDVYGQAVIPETLGFIDYAFFTERPIRPVFYPEDLIRQAKRLKVIRGAFASFFWHVDLMSPKLVYYQRHRDHFKNEGGKKTLTQTVEAIQALGYEFRSIDDRSLFPNL